LLNEISTSAENIQSVEQTLTRILDSILQILQVEGAAIFLYDDRVTGKPLLRFSQSAGENWPFFDRGNHHDENRMVDKSDIEKAAFAVGQGCVGIAAQRREPLNLDRERNAQEMADLHIDARHIRALCALPLTAQNRLLGVVVVQNLKTAAAFSQQDLFFLQSLVDQAANFMSSLSAYEELSKVDRLRREMSIAADIQANMLPQSMPTVDKMEIAGFIKPARDVGGDYYNFFHRSNDVLDIVIGDVSGKGLPASLIVVIAHTALGIIGRHDDEPDSIVVRFGHEMYTKVGRGQFMTLNYLRWNGAQRRLSFASAGHEHVLWYHAASNSVEKIKAGGIAAGLIEDYSKIVKQQRLAARAGDVFLLYTDGITEAHNDSKEMYTLARLVNALCELAPLAKPDAIRDALVRRIADFSGDAEQFDDMTMIVLVVT
jgi:serine phosphatase RsbU (regulator of sigma subunit)